MSGTVYLTSDFHFLHENIIKYCDRPFMNAHHMSKVIIENYNEVVTDNDDVFILGDFTMSNKREVVEDLASKLKGRKHLILGNHDNLKPFAYVDCGFASVHTSYYLEKYNLFMVHDPAVCIIGKKMGYNCTCGHIHGLFTFQNGVLNVGVDVHNFKPLSVEQVMEWWKK